MRYWGRFAFAYLILYFAIGNPLKLFAQAGAGYTKISTAPIATLTFTDSAVADGSVYQYEVTAANAAGESTPAQSGSASIPTSGTHSVTLSWGASTSAGVTYNIYRTLITVPNQPGVVSLTVN